MRAAGRDVAAAVALAVTLLVASVVIAGGRPNPEAGKEKAKLVCQPCHGLDGISLVRNYPNLAGQKELYLIQQLEAFRRGDRKSPELMSPIAAQLTDQEILDVAAYYSRLK